MMIHLFELGAVVAGLQHSRSRFTASTEARARV
jgi:hypothetical protein